MDEKRRFSRIFYKTPAQLHLADQVWQVELIDLSLKGALVQLNQDVEINPEHIYHLSFNLDGSDLKLVMSVQLTHQEGQKLGFSCHHIDIDSATHLRRIIELNLGDDELLMRDLNHLIEAAQ
ncbi:PilZ domain-containing protein [Catenovulum sp. SM1970]|uniref:PilZ domain-containing protein n=1 Tax=Marinifaba aquimaris TaxID=2741323 RepID=UPI001573CD29|nr:PilZ domain-containing protein [Marinifaba aquimaris]NTS77695.1 PilZ domain-containing protein [Marinifaba aquimaris]